MYTPRKVVWDDKFSTGDRSVDFQHKYLLETCNRLGGIIEMGADMEKLNGVLGRLKFYAEWHFSNEEECMMMHQCPAAAVNKQAHESFIKTLNSYLEELKETGQPQSLAETIHSDLVRWLESHILNVDTQLLGCIHK